MSEQDQQDFQHMTDIAIIGGGPAGMFTAFYAGMRQASVKIIESLPQLGGQLAALYPDKYIYDVAGFPKITAGQLVEQLDEQMKLFPVQKCLDEKVIHVEKKAERDFEITTNKNVHRAKAIIITGGIGAFEPRKLAIPDAHLFESTNLHYSIRDLSSFAGKKVLLTGGGDSAVDWALMLEPIAEKVTLIHRRPEFRAHEHSVEMLKQSTVRIITPMEVTELQSDGNKISHVKVQKIRDPETFEIIEIDELIVNFGFVSSLGPIAEWGLEIEKGSIVVNSKMETTIPGIYAAGDITTYPGKVKLIAVGFGEAPTAVNNAKVYIDPTARVFPGHSTNMNFDR